MDKAKEFRELDKIMLLRIRRLHQGCVHENLKGLYHVGKRPAPVKGSSMTREAALALVREDGLQLGTLSDKLRGDHEVVFAALEQNGAALRFVHNGLAGKRDFLMEAVRRNPDAAECIKNRDLRREIQRALNITPNGANGDRGDGRDRTGLSPKESGGSERGERNGRGAKNGAPSPQAAAANGAEVARAAENGGSAGHHAAVLAAAAGAKKNGYPAPSQPPSSGSRRLVIAPFAAAPGADGSYLNLSIGETVEITSRDASGWTYGRKIGGPFPVEGWFPDWCA